MDSVIINVHFENLPPKLGFYMLNNINSKVYDNVNATIYFLYVTRSKTYSMLLDRFIEFLDQKGIKSIVHTSIKQSYYFKAITRKYFSRLKHIEEYLFMELYANNSVSLSYSIKK